MSDSLTDSPTSSLTVYQMPMAVTFTKLNARVIKLDHFNSVQSYCFMFTLYGSSLINSSGQSLIYDINPDYVLFSSHDIKP